MANLYIITGPAFVGNSSRYADKEVPEGMYVVVRDDDYVGGGHGPCSVDGTLYDTLKRAEEGLRELNEVHRKIVTNRRN